MHNKIKFPEYKIIYKCDGYGGKMRASKDNTKNSDKFS